MFHGMDFNQTACAPLNQLANWQHQIKFVHIYIVYIYISISLGCVLIRVGQCWMWCDVSQRQHMCALRRCYLIFEGSCLKWVFKGYPNLKACTLYIKLCHWFMPLNQLCQSNPSGDLEDGSILRPFSSTECFSYWGRIGHRFLSMVCRVYNGFCS